MVRFIGEHTTVELNTCKGLSLGAENLKDGFKAYIYLLDEENPAPKKLYLGVVKKPERHTNDSINKLLMSMSKRITERIVEEIENNNGNIRIAKIFREEWIIASQRSDAVE